MIELNLEPERKKDFSLDDLPQNGYDTKWVAGDSGEVRLETRRSTSKVWVGIAALAVALAIVAGYGYMKLEKDSPQIESIAELKDSFAALGNRVGDVEGRMKSFEASQQVLVANAAKLNARFKSVLDEGRKRSQAMVRAAELRLQKQIDQRTQELTARLASAEAAERSNQVRMAKLEKEVAGARKELAAFKQTHREQLSNLRQQEGNDRSQIASINHLLETDQVNFEAEKNRDEEIVPGVSVHVTGTDVAYQRYSGYIWFAPDRRTIWVHGQGAGRPVVFYSGENNQAYELVVQRVSKNSTVGYLLLPSGAGTTTSAALIQGSQGKADAGGPKF